MRLTLVGLFVDVVGALLIAAPDYPERVKSLVYPLFPRARALESARTKLKQTSELEIESDKKELEAFYPWLKKAYGLQDMFSDNPHLDENPTIHGIQLTPNLITLTFPDGESHGFTYRSDPRRVADRVTDRALERYFVKIGVLILVAGFTLQAIGMYAS